MPTDCANGNCVDGVCCASACSGACQSCGLAGSRGICSLVTGAPTTGHSVCNGSGSCAGRCDGRNVGCTYPAAETSCGSASCSNGSATSTGTCNGAGSCTAGQTRSCGAFACGNGVCLTSCNSNSQCAQDAACSGGSCAKCIAGETACEGACLNVQTSNAHCGSCVAAACAAGEQCTGGKCLLQDGRPCTTANQCASGSCPLFYLDSDLDGYPLESSVKGYCSVSSKPGSFYIPARSDGKWDCYDSDDTVNPGVTGYFSQANANYGWDWDCSGTVEKQQVQFYSSCVVDAASASCASTSSLITPSEACGATYTGNLSCMKAMQSASSFTCILRSSGGTVGCH